MRKRSLVQIQLVKDLALKAAPFVLFVGYLVGISYEAGYLRGMGFGTSYGLDVVLLFPFTWRDFLTIAVVAAGYVVIGAWAIAIVGGSLLVLAYSVFMVSEFDTVYQEVRSRLRNFANGLVEKWNSIWAARGEASGQQASPQHGLRSKVTEGLRQVREVSSLFAAVFVALLLATVLTNLVSATLSWADDISPLLNLFNELVLACLWLVSAAATMVKLREKHLPEGLGELVSGRLWRYAWGVFAFVVTGYAVIGTAALAHNIGVKVALSALSASPEEEVIELVIQHGNADASRLMASHIRAYDNVSLVVTAGGPEHVKTVEMIRTDSIRSRKKIVSPQTHLYVHYKPLCALIRITPSWCYSVRQAF